MAEFRMPSLGADMDEGVLLEWLVKPGATVHKGDIVAVVDTAKAAVEVETFSSGVVDRLIIEPGQRVPVGTVLATISETSAGQVPRAAPPAAPPAAAAPVAPVRPGPPPAGGGSPVASPLVRHLAEARHIDLRRVHGSGVGGRITHADVEQAAAQPEPPPGGGGGGGGGGAIVPGPGTGTRRRASPLARRLAIELGVDLAGVTGTGPGGAVDAGDVRRAAATRDLAGPAVGETTTAAGGALTTAAGGALAAGAGHADRTAAMRTVIANLMARSKREIPHYYLAEDVDLGPAMDWLHETNRRLPVPGRLVPAALLLKAAALALRTVPQLNGFWTEDQFVPGNGIHLGVAVSLRGGGLVAPAIHDAADLDLATIMTRMRDLVVRARAGRLRRAELSDPTITVSSMGEQGAQSIFGVIYPPQVALVGFGRVVDRPWAVAGLLGVRPVVTVSLAADHRATDGATGARYLQALARLLGKPEEL